MIKHISKSLSKYLALDATESTKHQLNDFVPKIFHSTHSKRMQELITNFSEEKMFNNLNLCLVNSYGYLVECSLNIDCVGFNSEVDFVVAVEPLDNFCREIALINDFGIIFNHSLGLSELLGERIGRIEGENLLEYFYNLVMAELLFGLPVVKEIKKSERKKVVLLLRQRHIGKRTINAVYIIHDEKIIEEALKEKKSENSRRLSCLLNLDSEDNFHAMPLIKSSLWKRSFDNREKQQSTQNFIVNVLQVADEKLVKKILQAFRSLKIFLLLSVSFI